eukprot:3604900-Alexandrium_andersonii.AAC.1
MHIHATPLRALHPAPLLVSDPCPRAHRPLRPGSAASPSACAGRIGRCGFRRENVPGRRSRACHDW